jgi:hypothetical protein
MAVIDIFPGLVKKKGLLEEIDMDAREAKCILK